jgi:hypothetical protein
VKQITLEKLLTSRQGFDLDASPLQRALVRAADGRPIGDGLDAEAVERHFGCDAAKLGCVRPTLVEVVAGVRSGKSLISDAAAVHGSLSADLSALKGHEISRFSIVAPTVDNATATFRLLAGSVQASPMLSKLLVGEPTSEALSIRRADGRVVEIMVVAASRGAVTLRSRWSAGFVLDEVALFGAESQGAVINADELLRAGETRLVPGAQGWIVSSPFGPSGLLYELYRAHFGKPGRVLVVHAPTTAMNPAFPIEQIEAIRIRTPDVAAREYDAEWVDTDTAFFDGPLVDAAVRAEPADLAPVSTMPYVAAWDAATRGNSWTLVIASVESRLNGEPLMRIAVARQWTGSRVAPLAPDVVIAEIGSILSRYGVKRVLCDGWGTDAFRPLARAAGFELAERPLSPEAKFGAFEKVRTRLATDLLELAPHPYLAADLKSVRKRVLSNGVRVDLPKTADGRHADFAPSVALVVEFARTARSRTSTENRPRGRLATRNFDASPIGALGPDGESDIDVELTRAANLRLTTQFPR